MKFNTKRDEDSFVHVATQGGEIMMVTSVKDGLVPRYGLMTMDGTTYRNIGEYELTAASLEDVAKALAARQRRRSE
jgi:hypothetical protein